MEKAGGDGAGHGGGQNGGQPDAGIADDIAHLEHGGAQSLTHQAAPAVFPKGEDRKAHHLGAAPRHGGAPRQAGEAQGVADGGGGDGQGKKNAHQHRYDDPHQERLQLGGPHDDRAHAGGRLADGGCPPHGQRGAHEDGHEGGDQNVHLRFPVSYTHLTLPTIA